MSKTLPREIIKWIQSLDLSYSYKDSRRDLNNGFIIAEIFSRYHSGKLSMHSFDNSSNTAKMSNNWFLLSQFIRKQNLPFKPEEFARIKAGDFEQLVTFMIKLYSVLTKRSVTPNPYGVARDIPLPATDEKTETYLLTNKGMEKLDVSKEIQKEDKPEAKKNPRGTTGTSSGFKDRADGPAGKPEPLNRIGERRNSRKSYNHSQGDSHIEGVGAAHPGGQRRDRVLSQRHLRPAQRSGPRPARRAHRRRRRAAHPRPGQRAPRGHRLPRGPPRLPAVRRAHRLRQRRLRPQPLRPHRRKETAPQLHARQRRRH